MNLDDLEGEMLRKNCYFPPARATLDKWAAPVAAAPAATADVAAIAACKAQGNEWRDLGIAPYCKPIIHYTRPGPLWAALTTDRGSSFL
jgi:hypothetical protein